MLEEGIQTHPEVTMSRSQITPSILALTLLSSLLFVGCDVTVTVDENITEALECDLTFDGNLDATYEAPSFNYLLETTGKLNDKALAVETSLKDACNALALELGAAEGEDATSACGNVTTAVADIKAANPDASITSEYIPAECWVEAGFALDCAASCDATVDVTTTPLVCEGGTLSGTCTGSCSGSCTVDVEAECSGTCHGTCVGTCTVTAEDGSCAGECEGTCQGSCTASVEAECAGTCRGECDLAWEEPRCEGGTLEVEASADCEAACEAQAAFQWVCTAPEMNIVVEGTPATDTFDALVGAAETQVGVFIKLREEAREVTRASAAVYGSLDNATAEAVSIGLNASACLVSAGAAHLDAIERIDASISLMVEVEGSVSATASTN